MDNVLASMKSLAANMMAELILKMDAWE